MTDPIDRANDTAQFFNNLALRRHRQGRTPLDEVWAGGVVVCADCDQAIPSARLKAVPDCERCVDCQTVYEIRERQ
jgi:phage/conjugal plasmid C-4 type zinc finger TraR family protein